jgi:acyl-coenzyme A synthetase/AMP-(fatty) acid ligase
VVGVPDSILGEAVKVVVILDAGSRLTAEDLLKFCAANLETVLMPKFVEVVAAMPRTPTGKIDKMALRQRAPAAQSLEQGA